MQITTVISIISLLIALTTFFLTQLQPARLSSQSGPFIKIYYADFEQGGSFGLYLPVTFINKSTKTGVVLNAAITLCKKDSPEEIFFMHWREFSKLDDKKNQWVFEQMAHAIAVSGKSTVAKVIWFMWNTDSQPKLILREGGYKLDFHFWYQKDKPALHETHEFFVGQSVFAQLEKYRDEKRSTVIDLRLDKDIEDNRAMTRHELKKLLG